MVINIESKEQFEEALKEHSEDQVFIVKFSSEGCGPCKMMKKVITDLLEEFDIPVYEVSINTNYELADIFGVRAVPTTVIFKGKNEVATFVGYMPKENIATLIKEAIKQEVGNLLTNEE
jgi:thioredoxin 1